MVAENLYSREYFEGQASIERYAPFSLLSPLTKRSRWLQIKVLKAIKGKERRFAQKRARNIVNCFNPQKTLDVGTATGELIEALLKLQVDAWGIEPSHYLISNMKSRLRERVLEAYADELPFESRSFDVVTAYHVLEHIENDKLGKNLKEIARVSKSILLIEFPTTKNPWSGVDNTHISIFGDEWWLKKLKNTLPEWEVNNYRPSNAVRAMQVSLKMKRQLPKNIRR